MSIYLLYLQFIYNLFIYNVNFIYIVNKTYEFSSQRNKNRSIFFQLPVMNAIEHQSVVAKNVKYKRWTMIFNN